MDICQRQTLSLRTVHTIRDSSDVAQATTNEQSGLIVAMISFVFHLKWNEKIKIDKIVDKYAFSLIQNLRN